MLFYLAWFFFQAQLSTIIAWNVHFYVCYVFIYYKLLPDRQRAVCISFSHYVGFSCETTWVSGF